MKSEQSTEEESIQYLARLKWPGSDTMVQVYEEDGAIYIEDDVIFTGRLEAAELKTLAMEFEAFMADYEAAVAELGKRRRMRKEAGEK